MTTLVAAPTPARRGDRRVPTAWLRGTGTAVPDLIWPQEEIAGVLAALWRLRGPAAERWRRICDHSGVDTRHGVAPPETVMAMTTAERMVMFERFAPGLAATAATRALADAGVDAARITDLIVVSCTGFAAPGLDVALVDRLGLDASVRRTTVGFMGCFGAITGLRTATAMCAADPDAVALVVCAELCSLHVRDDTRGDNLVASALFGDGAAAAVLGPGRRDATDAGPSRGRLTPGRSQLVPEGRTWMTWRVTDRGFAMTLSRAVPAALRRAIGAFVGDGPGERRYVVHPGGPGILDAVASGLDLGDGGGIEISRDVLRRYGNVSSGTVLFVLAEALRRGDEPPLMALAFGPGLSIESVELIR